MADQLYIRVRGRVLGPYERDKLQALVKRGQLGRLHEVSEDGSTWVRASTFPELFATGGTSRGAVTFEEEPPLSSGAGEAEVRSDYGVGAASAPTGAASIPNGQGWYYTSNGGQAGPVDFATLQRMASAGQLGPGELVWTDGMSQWSPPNSIPGLVVATNVKLPHDDGPFSQRSSRAAEESNVSDDVCRALAGSKPWIMFVAIMVFVYAALQILGGGMLVLTGSVSRTGAATATGTGWILSAIIEAVGGYMLVVYANRIGLLTHTRKSQHLASALEAARVFWVYIGILLIVGLAIATLIGIAVLAIGGSF